MPSTLDAPAAEPILNVRAPERAPARALQGIPMLREPEHPEPFAAISRAFLAFCRLEKGNGARWLRFQALTLAKFTAWAMAGGASGWEGLEPFHLSEFLTLCEREEDTRNTLHRRATIIRACARWAERQGRLRECRLTRAALPQVIWLPREIPDYGIAVQLVLQEPDLDLRDAYMLAILTGLRRGELLALPWPRINLEQGLAEVRATDEWKPKSKRARMVPLEAAAVDILRRRKRRNDGGPFIKAGAPVLAEWRITKGFKKIARAAGLPKLRFHDLRHEFCTRLVRETNLDLSTAQEVLGHASIQTTRRYAHPRRDSAVAARDALNRAALNQAEREA